MLFVPVILLLIAKPTPKSFWIGLPFIIIGEAIRIWSAGYLDKLERLITGGPFALCRNPLYIGSFFISVGYFIICGNPVILTICVILFWVFHCGAVIHEEKMLREKFGQDFLNYCKAVPRFIPRFRSSKGNGEFSISQLMSNREPKSMLGTAIMLVIFTLMTFMFDSSILELLQASISW